MKRQQWLIISFSYGFQTRPLVQFIHHFFYSLFFFSIIYLYTHTHTQLKIFFYIKNWLFTILFHIFFSWIKQVLAPSIRILLLPMNKISPLSFKQHMQCTTFFRIPYKNKSLPFSISIKLFFKAVIMKNSHYFWPRSRISQMVLF